MGNIEQKTLETYFQQASIEDPDVKMKIITEINQMVYDRNEAIRKLEDESMEEYQKNQLVNEIEELEGHILKTIEKK